VAPSVFDLYESITALGATERHAARALAMKRAFEGRTGSFSSDDPWFEARSRAFWDDAITTQGFAAEVAAELPPDAAAWIASFRRAHRGLFRVKAGNLLEDVWGGAEFVVDLVDAGTADALEAANGVFDARLVGHPDGARVAMLPGALYHPEDATEPIAAVLEAARRSGLSTGEVLDALLRMERSLRSLSRVKAAYAYRAAALKR
jgi:hypothetical protein